AHADNLHLPSFPTRRSSDLEFFLDCQPGAHGKPLKPGGLIPVTQTQSVVPLDIVQNVMRQPYVDRLRIIIDELGTGLAGRPQDRSEEHTSELQSRSDLVCRL